MKSITIDTIESPKTQFTENERSSLVDVLVPVARDGFGTPITREDVDLHAFSGDFMHLLKRDGRIVGFSTYRRFATEFGPVLHFNGTVIERDSQRCGLYRLARTLAFAEERPAYFTLRTQNPVIYGVAQDFAKKIYPNGRPVPEHVLSIARCIGGDTMESETLVVRGFYGTSLYDTIPECGDVNRFFNESLRMNYQRGDAVIAVGSLR